MLVTERPPAAARVAQESERPRVVGRRLWPVTAMAAGVVLVLAALLVVQLAAPTLAPASTGLTLGGPVDVSGQTATYEPGQTSGWHRHTGMHAVTVLSGTITFYGEACQAHRYGPGDTYVGGQEVHLVRNETSEPAQLVVTYLFPAGQPHTTFHVDAQPPAGCDVR